jgi:hypothetical protein
MVDGIGKTVTVGTSPPILPSLLQESCWEIFRVLVLGTNSTKDEICKY